MPPTLTVLMGPPGAGKTTWMEANPITVVCSTERLRTDRSLTTQATIAFLAGLQTKARRALNAGQDVLIDGCNTKRHERSRWLAIARDYGAKTRLVALDTPLSTCLTVQLSRAHPVPAAKVARYHQEFVRSLSVIGGEGWDSTVCVSREAPQITATAGRW